MAGLIPMWYVKARTKPGGRRIFPKLVVPDWERLHKPPASSTFVPVGRMRRRDFPPLSEHSALLEVEVMGNLSNEEYQFFIGTDYATSDWAYCRVCNTGMGNAATRKAHGTGMQLSCQKKAQIICRYLAKSRICVVCDARTQHHKWGLPICKTVSCLKSFKFSHNTSKGWRAAQVLAESNSWTI